MSTKRILVVDDEQLTRMSLADFLQEIGYETKSAGDGNTALKLQKRQPFNVCIVDIRMPGMDGIETISALHQVDPHSQFIIYTGSPQFTLPHRLQQIGLSENNIVRKPVTDMHIFDNRIKAMTDPKNPNQEI